MKTTKLKPLFIAMAFASPVMAQEASDAPVVEEVLVTGFRQSLATALNVKRDNASQVDSIMAEDIGKFPDNNLAEAMARIPGVNISRVGGEGQQISVRGLSSDFSRVRVNGMETIAAGYGNASRSFDFNIFASELFNRIDVRKTQEARVEEGSLGATVELYTARPLASSENSFLVSGSAGYNSNSEEVDPRIVGLASLQNEDGTFGGSVSIAYSERNVLQGGHNSGRWEANANSGNDRWANSDSLPAEINSAFHPRFPRQLDRDLNLERLGLTGTLQWQPADGTDIVLDILHSDFTYQQQDITLTPISLARTGAGGRLETTVNEYEFNESRNALLYADLTGVDTRSEAAFVDADTSFDQVSLSISHDLTESVTIKGLVGTSKSTTDVKQESTAIFERFDADFTYDYRGNEQSPTLSYDFNLTSPENWQISEIRNRPAETENTYDVVQLDLSWQINDVLGIDFGATRKEFGFENFQARADRALLGQNGSEGALAALPEGCNLTLNDLQVTPDLGYEYTPFNGQNRFFLPDFGRVAETLGFSPDSACFPLVTADNRSVTETTTGAYAQLNFNTEVAALPVFGNVGVRSVDTDQESSGLVGVELITRERSYSDTLPAINLNIELMPDLLLRASWAEVLSRPSLGNLTPGGRLDGFNRVFTAGNPNLDPFRADATDLSVEWYFTDEAMVSLAWFKKNIDSFPASIREDVPWSALDLPDSLLDNVPATTEDTFNYRYSVNGDGGELDGWELQFQTPFTFGPSWLQDFGVRANYTSIDSSVNYGTAEAPILLPLNGQSDESYNTTLWYENENGFQARVSYTYRSEYPTLAISRLRLGSDFTDETSVVDANVSYEFSDNLTVTIDLLNLTDESETWLMGDVELVDTVLTSGRQYYLGLRYSF